MKNAIIYSKLSNFANLQFNLFDVSKIQSRSNAGSDFYKSKVFQLEISVQFHLAKMAVLVYFVITLIGVAYLFLKMKFSYFANRGIPFDPPTSVMGNLSGIGTKIQMHDFLKRMYDKYRNSHKICGFYALHIPVLLAIDLDLIKNILVKDFKYFAIRDVYHDEEIDPLSAHLFSINGEKWRRLRRSMAISFSSGRLKNMFTTASGYTDDLVNLVKQLNNPNGVDMKAVGVRFGADLIGALGYGIKLDALRDDSCEMIRMTKFFEMKDFKTRLNFFLVNLFPEMARKLRMRVTPDYINEYFMGIIKNAYEMRMKSDDEVDSNDFMSVLINLHKFGKMGENGESDDIGKITFNELAAQAFVFFTGS